VAAAHSLNKMGHLAMTILHLKGQLMLGREKVRMAIKRKGSTYNIVVELSLKRTND
jgi:hypothetical protein